MDYYAPIISFNPSMVIAISSGDALPILLPILSTDNVLIWLILTHDFLGSLTEAISSVVADWLLQRL